MRRDERLGRARDMGSGELSDGLVEFEKNRAEEGVKGWS